MKTSIFVQTLALALGLTLIVPMAASGADNRSYVNGNFGVKQATPPPGTTARKVQTSPKQPPVTTGSQNAGPTQTPPADASATVGGTARKVNKQKAAPAGMKAEHAVEALGVAQQDPTVSGSQSAQGGSQNGNAPKAKGKKKKEGDT